MPNADTRVAIPVGDRQYHIGLGPGDLAEYILLPGDQDRTDRVATYFDTVDFRHRHREFNTATGTYKGLRVSCLSTGIGTDNIEIVVSEILALVKAPTLIRIGSSGGLQEGMELGDLVISTGSVWLETMTSCSSTRPIRRLPTTRPCWRCWSLPNGLGIAITWGSRRRRPDSSPRRGRPIPQLPIRYPDVAAEMTRQGILNFEMEASALFVLASLGGCRAGAVCTVFANRRTGEFVTGEAKDRAEAAAVETGLESLVILAQLDRQQAQKQGRRAGARRSGPQNERRDPAIPADPRGVLS